MEITKEHKRRIDEIIRSMECPKDFECYESGFENLCKTQNFRDGNLVKCLEESVLVCKFSYRFGFVYFCKCPLRKYIAKNFNR